jgi:hypothetical protein
MTQYFTNIMLIIIIRFPPDLVFLIPGYSTNLILILLMIVI